MILQALHQLAQDENLISDPDYEMKPIAWLILVDSGGRMLGPIQGTHYLSAEELKKAKPIPRAKSFTVPRQAGRTSGARAFFLFDKAEYVLGHDPDGKRSAEHLQIRMNLFTEKVGACAAATGDEGAIAVLKFLERMNSGQQEIELPEGCVSNDLFAFIYEPDIDLLVTSREKIRNYWKSLRSSEETESSDSDVFRCLVSGVLSEPADKHPVVKNVPGGSSSGVAMVSFNSNAFESYGLKRNENAPVSRNAAEVCATSLNRLLHPAFPREDGTTLPKRNLRLSTDTAVCYWAKGQSADSFVNCFDGLLEAREEDVGELYQSVWKGRMPNIEDRSAFYALTLSGGQGRATVRDWFESTINSVASNLASHFGGLLIVRNTPPPKNGSLPPQFPIRLLLESLAAFGKSDDIPAPMASQLVTAAMKGTPYPFSILQRAVLRMRAEIGKTEWLDLCRRDARAALLKAVLNRRKLFYPDTCNYKEIKETMDPTNTNPGYLLGRLMAVIERMQQTALGDVNASVVDRFFSGASATPQATFPRLLKNMRHHASKAKDGDQTRGTARWLEGQVDSILSNLDGFPSSLNLEQQGMFVLGYHHQRHWLWMSKEKREQWEADQVISAS